MAKARGPLFSLEAHGTLSGTICYQRRRTGAAVFVARAPKQPETGPQLAQRASFASAVSSWRSLGAGSMVWWNERARGTATTGYHLYVKEYLLGLVI